jgi:DNA-binding XRE family transcriptional regulator
LTQYELADRVGVEQPSIHRIEKGRQGWDSKTLFGVGAALECSLADLFIEVEQVMPKQLPPEASTFARMWMLLPTDMRADYRRRIEGLVHALRQPVPDEPGKVGHSVSRSRHRSAPR